MKVNLRLWQGARPRWAGVQCEKTEAAIQEPIAAPAWPRYVTRPPFRLPCSLLAVRAAGDGFRRRHGELCARVHSWSGFLTYRCCATTLLVISHHQSYGRHGARHKLLAVRQHMSRVHRFGPAVGNDCIRSNVEWNAQAERCGRERNLKRRAR